MSQADTLVVHLPDDERPTKWYNIQADLPEPLPPHTRRALRLDAMAFDDFDASGRHRPSNLLDRDSKD